MLIPSESPESRPILAYDEASDDDINQTIDKKIAAARTRLSPCHCLFCSLVSPDLADNLTHMSMAHSFFIPDADYLIDISGLISYLGEKIAVGNICIFCSHKSREFRTLEAVRKHMVDKSHCKIAYGSSDDRLEISDYYDFTSSYPDAATEHKLAGENGDSDIWEDIEGGNEGGDMDEIIDEDFSSEGSQPDPESNTLPDNSIAYGDSHLELVLPSGARIGHRIMRKYYAQTFPTVRREGIHEDPNSGAALVRRLLADRNAALIPRKGGFGAFGAGADVVKARNRGEAREAGRHVREYRDQRRREDFKTKVAFIHNSQKHFRDPREYRFVALESC
jgi:pre-60S factor REI1